MIKFHLTFLTDLTSGTRSIAFEQTAKKRVEPPPKLTASRTLNGIEVVRDLKEFPLNLRQSLNQLI